MRTRHHAIGKHMEFGFTEIVIHSGTTTTGNRGAGFTLPCREHLYSIGGHWEGVARFGVPQCHLTADHAERAVHLPGVQSVPVQRKFVREPIGVTQTGRGLAP